MRVRNVSGADRGVTPPNAPHFHVEAGAEVEVSDALGKSLCAQPSNWQPVRETATEQEKE